MIEQSRSKQLRGVKKRVVLLVSSSTDGPWCNVLYVKAIEVLGADPESAIRLVVQDNTSVDTSPFVYVHKGSGLKHVNIPRGQVMVKRLRGTEPITVYAHCGV